ncbi:MAG TPA: hypothetical protein VE974_03395 [Thermoanaerobaculia bacterium]|nr:hypothetical protein [Thermoanaerobaculia bacterium]
MKDFLVWSPDRDPRYVRIERAPVDPSGKELELYTGMPEAPHTEIHVVAERGREEPDFLHDLGLLLFVSPRAKDLIAGADVPHLQVRPAVLWRKKLGKGDPLAYFFLNTPLDIPVMDEARSRFVRPGAVFRSIDYFAVDESRLPDEDLFIVEELTSPAFSEPLVSAIRQAGFTGATFTPLKGCSWPISVST